MAEQIQTITTIFHEEHAHSILRLSVARCGKAVVAVFQSASGSIELTESDIDFLRRTFAAIPPAPADVGQASAVEPTKDQAHATPNLPPRAHVEDSSHDHKDAVVRADPKNHAPVLPEQAGKRWSDEEEDRLRELLCHGRSIPEVAAVLKRSPGSVIARALLCGMIAVNVTPELVAQGDQRSDRAGEAGSERRAA